MKLKELVDSLKEYFPYRMIRVVGDRGWKIMLYTYWRNDPIVLSYFNPLECDVGCIVREIKISSEIGDYGLTIDIECYRGGNNSEILLASLISRTIQSTYVRVYLYKDSLFKYAISKLDCDNNHIKIQSHLFSLGSRVHTKKERVESCGDLSMCVSKCIDFLVENFGNNIVEYLKDLDYIKSIFVEKGGMIDIVNRTLRLGGLYNLYP